MSDNKTVLLNLIMESAYEVAQKIGSMELDDPRRASLLEEPSELTQLRRFLRLEADQPIGQHMDELAREMATVKPGDTQRAQIVHEVMRLRDLLKQD